MHEFAACEMIGEQPRRADACADAEQRSAQRLYGAFGRHLKYADGWKKYIISSEPEFEHYYGKQAVKKRKLYNGRLQCNVYMYY